jgi:hypothetical protein
MIDGPSATPATYKLHSILCHSVKMAFLPRVLVPSNYNTRVIPPKEECWFHQCVEQMGFIGKVQERVGARR